MDDEFVKQVRKGLYGSTNRAIGGLLGMPVDGVNYGLGLLGLASQRPVGGSEWIVELMARNGMIPPERYPTAEHLTLMALTPRPTIRMP